MAPMSVIANQDSLFSLMAMNVKVQTGLYWQPWEQVITNSLLFQILMNVLTKLMIVPITAPIPMAPMFAVVLVRDTLSMKMDTPVMVNQNRDRNSS